MAFLLLLHQKMSLQRKVNKLTLEQTQIASAKERMTKRIERVQQSFAKRQSKLDAEAKLATSRTNNMVSAALLGQTQNMGMISIEDGLRATDANLYEQYMKADAQTRSQLMKDNQSIFTQAQSYMTTQNNNISYQRQMCQQMANAFQTDANERIAIELEARKQALEDEEQLALAPLEEQDTQIDMRQASNEAQLSYAQSRLQNIESALQNSTQNAPKFGA